MKKIFSLPLVFSLALAFFAFFACLASAPAAFAAVSPRSEFEERRRAIAEMMEAATVWIVVEEYCKDCDQIEPSVGTGFIVGDGYIVTNAHVTDDLARGGSIYVLNEKIPAREAKVVKAVYEDKGSASNGRDIAILRFDPPAGVNLPILSFNFEVKRMDRVGAWGYPAMATKFDVSTEHLRRGDMRRLEAPPVVYTEGTVNAIVRGKLGNSILHSASIAGGNSGGPLVNNRGEVVGMNTWGYREKDEGAFLNGAQLAIEVAAFMAANGITPRLAPGQQLTAVRPYQDTPATSPAFGSRPGGATPPASGVMPGRGSGNFGRPPAAGNTENRPSGGTSPATGTMPGRGSGNFGRPR